MSVNYTVAQYIGVSEADFAILLRNRKVDTCVVPNCGKEVEGYRNLCRGHRRAFHRKENQLQKQLDAAMGKGY